MTILAYQNDFIVLCQCNDIRPRTEFEDGGIQQLAIAQFTLIHSKSGAEITGLQYFPRFDRHRASSVSLAARLISSRKALCDAIRPACSEADRGSIRM